jgi:hypothetical protein
MVESTGAASIRFLDHWTAMFSRLRCRSSFAEPETTAERIINNDTLVIEEPAMETTLAALILSTATVANGQTSVLGGVSPAQLFGVLGGPPIEAHFLPRGPAWLPTLEEQLLKTSDGDWYYVDNTQPCHLTAVKFVFRGGKVESWTRFVPVTTIAGIAGGGRVAPGSEPPPDLAEQELITRIKASRARISPFYHLKNWLGCSAGIVTDPN